MISRKPLVVAALRQMAVFAPLIRTTTNELTDLAVHLYSCGRRLLLQRQARLRLQKGQNVPDEYVAFQFSAFVGR